MSLPPKALFRKFDMTAGVFGLSLECVYGWGTFALIEESWSLQVTPFWSRPAEESGLAPGSHADPTCCTGMRGTLLAGAEQR